VWMDHIEASPTIYSWAMNNHWHTNYRAEQEGPTVFRYVVFPHGKYHQAQVAARALQYSQGVLVAPARGEVPTVPRLELSNANVLVSAFKPAEEGHAWIIRLFGISGRSEQVELAWPYRKPAALWLSSGSEKALVRVSGLIEVPAYTIVTLRAELR
jgi:alpha-mannosidase